MRAALRRTCSEASRDHSPIVFFNSSRKFPSLSEALKMFEISLPKKKSSDLGFLAVFTKFQFSIFSIFFINIFVCVC